MCKGIESGKDGLAEEDDALCLPFAQVRYLLRRGFEQDSYLANKIRLIKPHPSRGARMKLRDH